MSNQEGAVYFGNFFIFPIVFYNFAFITFKKSLLHSEYPPENVQPRWGGWRDVDPVSVILGGGRSPGPLSGVVPSPFGSVYMSSWQAASAPGSVGTWPTCQLYLLDLETDHSLSGRSRSPVPVWAALWDFATWSLFPEPCV